MKTFFFIIALFPSLAQAENLLPSVRSCIKQDYLTIEDVGSAQAKVTYINSDEACSNDFDGVITSDNGISVHINIHTGSPDEPGETITLIPIDQSYWSDPPMGYVPDNSVAHEFLIQGGMS